MIEFDTEFLRNMFDYNPITGEIKRKKTGRVLKKGDQGYVSANIKIDGVDRYVRAHRIAWQIHYGAPPVGFLDHINQNRADNRISNLRECNQSQNLGNSRLMKTNTSGLRGVSWNKQCKRWTAFIDVNGKKTYLGVFKDKEKAYEAYCAAAKEHFGEFFDPKNGRINRK